MITSPGFAVNVAIQIRARVLLKQKKYVFQLCHDSLGGGRIGLNNYLPRLMVLQ